MPEPHVLADPTPAPVATCPVPNCPRFEALDKKLDQVLVLLAPRPIDATFGGRVVAVVARLLEDAVVRRALALAVLAASIAGGGYTVAAGVEGLVLEPAGAAEDASGDAVLIEP